MKECSRRRAVSVAAVLLSFLTLLGTAHSGERVSNGLRVDYDPPRLSVEAQEASLADVLRAIGAKVGFSVVEAAPSTAVVTLSMTDASVDDVLQRLLRAESYTVLYQADAEATPGIPVPIDRVVLLGAAGAATLTATSAGPAPRVELLPEAAPDQSSTSSPVPKTPSLSLAPGLDSIPLLSWDNSSIVGNGSDPAVPPMTVGDLLKANAMAGVPPESLSNLQPPPPDSPAPPPNVSATLAETTQRAQQALAALINGLAAATKSLQRSPSPGGN
jgi:hypothetical protein